MMLRPSLVIHSVCLLIAAFGGVVAVAQDQSGAEGSAVEPATETEPAIENPTPVVEPAPPKPANEPATVPEPTVPKPGSLVRQPDNPRSRSGATEADGAPVTPEATGVQNEVKKPAAVERPVVETAPENTPQQAVRNQSPGSATEAIAQRSRGSSPPQPRQAARDDSRRSQLGISVGPGGIQVFRGDPRFVPGRRGPAPGGFYGRDPWRSGPQVWYPSRGWGIAIETRPPVVVQQPTPVIITQPQSVPAQPVASRPAVPQAPVDPPLPSEAELSALPGSELRAMLLYAVDRLDEELDGLSTGSGWKSYLQTGELRQLVPSPNVAPPPPGTSATVPPAEPILGVEVRNQLASIHEKFGRTADNNDFRSISRLWGFRATHSILRELLVPPVHRQRKHLRLAVELLEQELGPFDTAATWTAYLKVEELKQMSVGPGRDLSTTDRAKLKVALDAFDSASRNAAYRMITELIGFRQTQHLLRLLAPQAAAPPAPAS